MTGALDSLLLVGLAHLHWLRWAVVVCVAVIWLYVVWAFAGILTWAMHALSGWMLSKLFASHQQRGEYYRAWLERDQEKSIKAATRACALSRGSERDR